MYVDALHFRKDETIRVVERVDGKRVFKEFKPDWHFYVDDKNGMHKTIYGNRVKKIDPSCSTERNKLVKMHGTVRQWESDFNVVFRALEQNYQHQDLPNLHTAFFDIETDWDPITGYSDPQDALNKITSIAVYMQWIDQMVCLALPPPTLTWDEAQAIANKMPEVVLFKSEKEMLSVFLDLIEDADILSGWNSEFYDIPYTVNRVIRLLGKSETRKFNLWDQSLKTRMIDRGGKETQSYDLIGRVHLDYMQLYKNYTYEEKASYALNSIAEAELGEKKVDYEGSLDQLYKQDFEKFLRYNIQDTMLLHRLDIKLQYIDLCSSLAHATCVLLPTTMGAVAVTDQAVSVEAHNRGLVVPNKKRGITDHSDSRAAGGWVANPKKGLHKWIGSSDLNSLYPSAIRALNMSPETIVAQVNLIATNTAIDEYIAAEKKHTFADWWNDRFCPLEMDFFFEEDNYQKLRVDFEDGNTYEVTGKELKKLLTESGQPWCISANGTIFRTDIEGIIPGILTRWYAERKIMQGIKGIYSNTEDNPKTVGYHVPQDLFSISDVDENVHHASPYDLEYSFKPDKLAGYVKENNKKRVIEYMNQHKMTVNNEGKVLYRDQLELKKVVGFWDKRQLVKKINLNSAYGALLNAGSRFFDQRIGQSTTLTGRNITKHMAAKTNEFITGVYDHYGVTIIYGDTDSTYFSAYPALKDEIDAGKISWTKEDVTQLYDTIAEEVSNTFPQFLYDTFNVPISNSEGVIKSGREIVAESGLFIKKKCYPALVYDDEAKRRDVGGSPGKVKAMGLDLRRSDTPKFVQEFLSDILLDTLLHKGEDHVIQKIRDFKKEFDAMHPWKKGAPKSVNNLTNYREKEEAMIKAKLEGKKVAFSMPGHVRASLNWNSIRRIHNDNVTGQIVDGQKIIVCKMKETAGNQYSSVAYPVDEAHLPDWFTELPFDNEAMMAATVDKKVKNLLGVLKWDLSRTDSSMELMESLFDFNF